MFISAKCVALNSDMANMDATFRPFDEKGIMYKFMASDFLPEDEKEKYLHFMLSFYRHKTYFKLMQWKKEKRTFQLSDYMEEFGPSYSGAVTLFKYLILFGEARTIPKSDERVLHTFDMVSDKEELLKAWKKRKKSETIPGMKEHLLNERMEKTKKFIEIQKFAHKIAEYEGDILKNRAGLISDGGSDEYEKRLFDLSKSYMDQARDFCGEDIDLHADFQRILDFERVKMRFVVEMNIEIEKQRDQRILKNLESSSDPPLHYNIRRDWFNIQSSLREFTEFDGIPIKSRRDGQNIHRKTA